MKNYLIYPCKTMRITQSYTGTTSHLPHTTGLPKDYPWDEGCSDTGRDWFYCPCDEMIVRRIYGVGTGGTNTMWLQSTSEVVFADGTTGFVVILITHPNDDDLRKIKVGQIFLRGEQICREGKDGATGYHFHFSAGKGQYKGNGWVKNSKGKYVLTATGGQYIPEKLFFIDPEFTKVVNSKGLKFKELPEEYDIGSYKVTTTLLRVRRGAGTKYAYKKFSELSAAAQKRILKLTGNKKKNGYVKGLTFTVYEVKDNWGRTPSGWVCLDYCKKI